MFNEEFLKLIKESSFAKELNKISSKINNFNENKSELLEEDYQQMVLDIKNHLEELKGELVITN